MEEKIKELLKFHRTAKLSCEHDLKDLTALITDEENKPLREAINKLQQENSMRCSFICDLEDILLVGKEIRMNKIEKEIRDKF